MPPLPIFCIVFVCVQIKGRNSLMTKAISMAIELDQDIIATNMSLKFGEDWINSFQELDRKQSSGRTDKGNPICRHFVGA